MDKMNIVKEMELAQEKEIEVSIPPHQKLQLEQELPPLPCLQSWLTLWHMSEFPHLYQFFFIPIKEYSWYPIRSHRPCSCYSGLPLFLLNSSFVYRISCLPYSLSVFHFLGIPYSIYWYYISMGFTSKYSYVVPLYSYIPFLCNHIYGMMYSSDLNSLIQIAFHKPSFYGEFVPPLTNGITQGVLTRLKCPYRWNSSSADQARD